MIYNSTKSKTKCSDSPERKKVLCHLRYVPVVLQLSGGAPAFYIFYRLPMWGHTHRTTGTYVIFQFSIQKKQFTWNSVDSEPGAWILIVNPMSSEGSTSMESGSSWSSLSLYLLSSEISVWSLKILFGPGPYINRRNGIQ